MTTRERSDPAWTIVSVVFRVGLIIGGSLLTGGVLIGLFRGDTAAPALRLTDLAGNLAVHSRLEIAGIATFAVTPAAGVLALIVAWVRERDWVSAIVAVAVLAILTAGMVIGHG
jgi:hypothetical protein